MNQNTEGRTPDGSSETEAVELGEPVHSDEAQSEEREQEARPDLDERERRISTQRKPMGPPLREPIQRKEPQRRERTEGPVDPADS